MIDTELLKLIVQNPCKIKEIENPSEELQIAAVEQNVHVLREIENPSEKVQIAALKKDAGAFRYIKNPSYEIKKIAININPCMILYYDFEEELQILGVKQIDWSIPHIDPNDKDTDFWTIEIREIHKGEYLDRASNAVKMAAINQCADAIRLISNPSEDLQLQAIKKDKNSIQYISDPTQKVREFLFELEFPD